MMELTVKEMSTIEELKLKSIFDNVVLGIIVLDKDLKIESLNTTAEKIFKSERNKILHQPFTAFLNDMGKVIFQTFIKGVSKKHQNLEIEIYSPDDGSTCCELDMNVVEVHDQLIYVGTIKDISERKRLRKEMQKQLQEKIAIEERLEKEEELSNLKTRFISIASHEFRTPLTRISSSMQLIDQYIESEEDYWKNFKYKEKVEHHLKTTKDTINSLDMILNNFLSLAKLQDGTVSFNISQVDLSSLLYDCVEQMTPLCKREQKINFNFTGLNTLLSSDASLLKIIFNNLLSNAIKYSGEETVIALRSEIKEGFAHVEIEDKGIGIPIDEQNKLFTRFFRARNASTIQGTGLGLNIIRRYIDLLGGSITFESEENVGTTFYLKIPLEQPDEA